MPSDKTTDVLAMFEAFFGSGYLLRKTSNDGLMLTDAGDRMRIRLEPKADHGDRPHFHYEIKQGRHWRDATPTHRFYFREEQPYKPF